MSIFNEILIGLIPIVFLTIIGYLGLKYYEKRAISIVSEIVEIEKARIRDDLQKYVNTEEFQKFIYTIGGFLGSGAGTGLGIPKTSGKMNFKNMIIEIGGQFLKEKIMPGLGKGVGIGQQNLNRNKLEVIPEAK